VPGSTSLGRQVYGWSGSNRLSGQNKLNLTLDRLAPMAAELGIRQPAASSGSRPGRG
jgi:hypothetical protein